MYITNIMDLKEFLHDRGINLKFLNKIKKMLKSSKFVKKIIHTSLVAKICKDFINSHLAEISRDK